MSDYEERVLVIYKENGIVEKDFYDKEVFVEGDENYVLVKKIDDGVTYTMGLYPAHLFIKAKRIWVNRDKFPNRD